MSQLVVLFWFFTYYLPLTCTKNLYKSHRPVEQAKIKNRTDGLRSASSDAARGELRCAVGEETVEAVLCDTRNWARVVVTSPAVWLCPCLGGCLVDALPQ